MKEIRRTIHSNAETGFYLQKTLNTVKEELARMDIMPIPCGKSGLIALVGSSIPQKTLLLRADMDALTIKE